jgi:hypothetical protein
MVNHRPCFKKMQYVLVLVIKCNASVEQDLVCALPASVSAEFFPVLVMY